MSIVDFGGNRAKQLRISPDGFVQMAYQLAHKRAKGFLGATYESVSTRHYHHGQHRSDAGGDPRSGAVRGCDGRSQRRYRPNGCAAFRTAAEKHVQRAKECQAGRAPEQQLWELQLIQERLGPALGVTEPLALFHTSGWTRMREDYLSTSGVPSNSISTPGSVTAGSLRLVRSAPRRVQLYLSRTLPEASICTSSRQSA